MLLNISLCKLHRNVHYQEHISDICKKPYEITNNCFKLKKVMTLQKIRGVNREV